MPTPVGAAPPPPGVTPVFNGPLNDKQKQIILTSAIMMALSTLFMGLRLFTRAFIVKSIGTDDYAAVLAWMFAVTFGALSVAQVNLGFAEHLYNLEASQAATFLKSLTPISIIYNWAVLTPKLSLLLLYHRLSLDKTFRIVIYVVGFITIIEPIIVSVIIAVGCGPIDGSGAGCLNTLGFTSALINISLDAIVLVLPLPLVWSLQLPIRQKIALGSLFAGGSFVIIASIIRVKFVKELAGKTDITFAEGDVGIWSLVEVLVGIVCLSLVVMKPFFRLYLRGILGSSTGDSNVSPFSLNIGSIFSRFKNQRQDPRSYRLNSMDRSTRRSTRMASKAGKSQTPASAITVSHTYQVSRAREDGETESTEDIMKSSEGQPGHLV